MPNPLYNLWEKIKEQGHHPLGFIHSAWERVQAGRVAIAAGRASQAHSVLRGRQGVVRLPEKFALPGAGTGRVLTGRTAWRAARDAFREAKEIYDPLMGMMGRETQDPRTLLRALKGTVGGRGTPIFKETPAGGKLGLRLAGKDLWLATQYGPYVLTPSIEQGVTISTAGTLSTTGARQGKEITELLTESLTAGRFADAHVNEIRSHLLKQVRMFRGGSSSEDAAILRHATGTQIDFFKMNLGASKQVAELMGDGYDMETAQKAVAASQKLGYHPLFGKPDAILRGVMPLMADPTRLFPNLVAKGRPLYQDIAYAGLVARDVAAFETSWAGNRLPRIRLREGAVIEKLFSRSKGLEQGVIAPIGQIGREHPWFSRMTGGQPDIEQIIISKEMAQNLRYQVGRGFEHVGIGTPIKLAGKSFIVGGVVASGEMGGRHALLAADLTTHPDRYAELLLGDAMYNSVNIETGRLRRGVSGIAQALGLGTFSTSGIKGVGGKGQQIIFTPNKTLAKLGLGTVVKKIVEFSRRAQRDRTHKLGRDIGIGQPFKGVMDVVAELHVRGGGMQIKPSFGGMKASPLDLQMLAATGPRSQKLAETLSRRALRVGWREARSLWTFFSAFTGHKLRPSLFTSGGFQRMAPEAISSELIAGLTKARTVRDLQTLFKGGHVPAKDIVLKLPRAIKLPTSGAFREGGQLAFREVSEIALPSIRFLERHIPNLSGLEGEALETALDQTRYLPSYARSVGRALSAALDFSKAPTFEAETKLMEALTLGTKDKPGVLAALASHIGRDKMLSRALQPEIGGSVYTRIVQGIGTELGGLPAVGVGEVGMSQALFRETALQAGWREAEIVKAVKAGEAFGVMQSWPSLVPGTQGATRVSIIPEEVIKDLGRTYVDPQTGQRVFEGAHKVLVTNPIGRALSFRDVDFDPGRLALFQGLDPELRAAWKEHQQFLLSFEQRINAFWAKAGAAPTRDINSILARTLSLEDADVEKLLAQKMRAAKHDRFRTQIQEVLVHQRRALEKEFGGSIAQSVHALGAAQQLAGIKKGKAGQQGTEIFQTLRRVGKHGDLTATAANLAKMLSNMGEEGQYSQVFLGYSEKEYQTAAMHLAKAAQMAKSPGIISRITSLLTGKGRKKVSSVLDALEEMEPELAKFGGMRTKQVANMLGYGEKGMASGVLEAKASIAAQNAATKEAGAAVAKAGGLWAKLSMPWKIGLGIAGGLVGLRMIKSTLFGDEPEMPQQSAGPPLPPEPIGMPGGLHDQLSRLPLPAFSPPTARVISPLQRSPRVTMNATAPQGMDFGGLSDSLAVAAMSSAGSPLAGVFSSDVSNTSRIDMNIAESLRSENRLYM